jgi:molecular chaperone HtpG
MLEDLAKHDKHEATAGDDGVTDVVDADDKAKEGKYTQFYAEFGAVLKEGLGEDFANRSAWPSCCALPPPPATA